MKIALAPEGSRGDVFPMLDLGAGLVCDGHEVVICAPPGFRSVTEERGLEFRSTGSDVHAFLAAHADALARGRLRLARAAHLWLAEILDREFESLPEATADADLVIGAGLQLAGPSAAERRGIPYRYLLYCPALLPSAAHAPIPMTLQSLPRWANRLGWTVARAFYNRRLGPDLNRRRAGLGLGPVPDVFRYLVSERPILAADAELASAADDHPVAVTQIGCLHAMDPTPLPEKLESFLDSGPPPVFLGFGSMTDPDPDATTRLMFEAISDLDCRALISEGWAGYGRGALPDRVQTVGSVSHARLFPRVSAVVHHGGAGTTTMAARCGVPQLVVPHGADQFYWGRRVRLLGLGPPPLPRRRLTRERLAALLAQTLENEVLAERARELAVRLRSRLGPEAARRDRSSILELTSP
jgi:vancomycin aglycone glucosyltransferase